MCALSKLPHKIQQTEQAGGREIQVKLESTNLLFLIQHQQTYASHQDMRPGQAVTCTWT